MKRLIGIVIVLVLALQSLSVIAWAEDPNAVLNERKLQLEQKYDINITYELEEDGKASIGTGSLATLDKALNNVTASVVKQVSAYYQTKLDTKLTYSFVYTTHHDLDSNVEILASFNKENAVIELYMPRSSAGTFSTGVSPITIVHEFAHAYYVMFVDQYGEAKMEKEWTALNGGVKYNEGFLAYAYNKVTFMSSYGATSLGEDFAEIFSHAYICNKEGQGFSHRLMTKDQKTSLGKKVDFISNTLSLYMNNTAGSQANLQKAYTTPISLYYQDVKLSGAYMEFMGCTPPRYVLNGILSLLEIRSESSDWITDIGGWQVKDTSGKYYLIFPGGTWFTLDKPLEV